MPRRGVFIAALLVGLTGDVEAHLKFPKLKGERRLVLDLSGSSAELQYRVGFGVSLADAERKAADKDGDFLVGVLEANAAMDAKTASLAPKLRVCTGVEPGQLACRSLETRDVSRMESEGWVPGPTRHLHVTWTFDLRVAPESIGAIVVEDDYQVPGLEITDVAIEAPPHAKLIEAGDADRAGGVSTEFTWIESARPKGPRRVVAVWPGPPATGRLGLVLGVAAAILAAVLWFWPRKKRAA